MMFNNLVKFMDKPRLYAVGTDMFWNDHHISKALLDAHLNSDIDAASRKAHFLDKSVSWISTEIPYQQYTKLLDLGCGPGLYAERFANAGYTVTGIDFSNRSIAYAKEQTKINKSNIKYYYQNYLTIDFNDEFDIITLIYCDFGALSDTDRSILLNKIYRALREGGKFILDVFTPVVYMKNVESRSWEYCPDGGFWNSKPHIRLNAVYHYNEDNTELRQTIVLTEEATKCYNIWEHFFTKESLLSEMQNAGFNLLGLYGDVTGKEFMNDGDTICGIFIK